MYEKLYEAIIKEDADVAECNLKIVYPERVELFTDKRYYQVCTKQEYLEEYLKIEKIFGSACVRLIKTNIAKKIEFPVGKLYEDTYYAYDLISIADKYVLMDNACYNYLMRENSITNAKFNPRIFDLIEIVEKFHVNVYQNYDSLFGTFKVGRRVNIESDLLARYVARQLFCKQDSTLSWDDVERISSLY